MELELLIYGSDRTIRLCYEDRIEGKDRIFLLGEGGTAFECGWNDDEQETFTPVNLVEVLRAMALARVRAS